MARVVVAPVIHVSIERRFPLARAGREKKRQTRQTVTKPKRGGRKHTFSRGCHATTGVFTEINCRASACPRVAVSGRVTLRTRVFFSLFVVADAKFCCFDSFEEKLLFVCSLSGDAAASEKFFLFFSFPTRVFRNLQNIVF